jgi:hypothetical protein
MICGALLSFLSPSVWAQTATPVATTAPNVRVDTMKFDYLPEGFTVGPLQMGLNWHDFQESFLYENPSHNRWTVFASGFFFAGANPCNQIPKSLRPRFSKIKLKRNENVNGTIQSETHTVRTAHLVGGPALAKWIFAGEQPLVAVKLPDYQTRKQVSALIACDGGASIIASGQLTTKQLSALFRDSTDQGKLIMTDWASASNPVLSARTLTGPAGAIRVEVSQDPRTQRGLEIAGAEHITVRNHRAQLIRSQGNITLAWIDQPGLLVTVGGFDIAIEELVKVAAGMSGVSDK